MALPKKKPCQQMHVSIFTPVLTVINSLNLNPETAVCFVRMAQANAHLSKRMNDFEVNINKILNSTFIFFVWTPQI